MLQGRIALVTGAANGIGKATALALAAAGARIAAFDLDEAGVRTTAEACGSDALPVAIDLGNAAAIGPAVERVLAHFGRIDILANVAGITGANKDLVDTDESDWDRVFAINLKAPFLLMQAVARHMIARGGGGRIVNVTSSSAHRALMSKVSYGASKSGLAQLTRSVAAELGPHDINVNAVAPGLTRTDIVARHFTDASLDQALSAGPIANLLHRVSLPEDIAATILFLCLPASRQITGQTIHVSGGAIV
jgi:NAD(P)-dependent dehydrogenase (short-subunit alcohol dehydrogenase family)